ncbi:hypothetical protein [Streptomyces sp. NPDC089919]|uniref:hypothetical protein n=1 Tax=Streptomyces sp. NPDC089919 TaxID=3155188 RepID=UPI00342D4737
MTARRVLTAVAVVCALLVVGSLIVLAFADLNKAADVASVVGTCVGVVGFVVSVFALTRTQTAGARSVQAGGSIGRVVTGDKNRLDAPGPGPVPAAGPAGPGQGGSPAVPGERGVAARGHIGEAVTGDENQQP